MKEDKIFQVVKIIRRYTKLTHFKEYFKELCYNIFPLRKNISDNVILKVLDKQIPIELLTDESEFTAFFKTFQRYEEFNIWPVHIHDLCLILADIFKDFDSIKQIQSFFELLEKLLVL